MREYDYIDEDIVRLIKKVEKRQEKFNSERKYIYDEFSLILQDDYTDMDEVQRYAKYPRLRRPSIIKVNGNTSFTLSMVKKKQDDLDVAYENVKSAIKKDYGKSVLYEEGDIEIENSNIKWFEFKGFGFDGIFYSIFFFFDTKASRVLGTFQCPFSEYDIWKPKFMEIMYSIQLVK